MNLTDLHDVMTDRSAPATSRTIHQIRMAGVQTKAKSIRRRRTAGSVMAGLAVLLSGYAIAPGLVDAIRGDQRVTMTSGRDDNGFAYYQSGRKLVGSVVAVPSHPSLALSMTLNSPELAFVPRCEFTATDGEAYLWWELTANGHDLGSGSCNSDGTSMVSWDRVGEDPMDLWSGFGIDAGDPVRFEFTITKYERWNTETDSGELLPIPQDVTLSLGIYQRVPFEDYPFPPRPDKLTPLDEAIAMSGVEKLRIESGGDPLRHRAAEITLSEKLEVAGVAQTPGLLEIRVDGTLVHVHESWDFELGISGPYSLLDLLREKGISARVGQRVTVDVQPIHVTGEWRVVLADQSGEAVTNG